MLDAWAFTCNKTWSLAANRWWNENETMTCWNIEMESPQLVFCLVLSECRKDHYYDADNVKVDEEISGVFCTSALTIKASSSTDRN